MTSTTPRPAWGDMAPRLEASAGNPAVAAEQLLDELSEDEILNMLSGDMTQTADAKGLATTGYNHVPYPAGAVDRLGYPGVRFADGPRGIVVFTGTAFPVPMARGATFDPDLEREIGNAIGIEGIAAGANYFAGVCINLLRHPAWGRAQETYGEDTIHLGRFGAALNESVGAHMATCVKHYAVNSMENSRFIVDVTVADADLRDIYLPHFKSCVDAGVDSFMSAYNKVNGTWAGHHHRLLTEILRDDWGFRGFVMSDFTFGVRNMADAVNGGQDIEMPHKWRARKLPKAIADGAVTREQVRTSARRITRTMFEAAKRTGMPSYPRDAAATPEHRAIARRAAQQSFVLLENRPVGGHPALPLSGNQPTRLGLFGSLAAKKNTGDVGSSKVTSSHVVTASEGLRAAADRRGVAITESLSDDLDAAATIADRVDTAVVVVGNTWREEGEFIGYAGGDRKSLRLSKQHEALVEAVAAKCERTIVVLVGGSAFVTESWNGQVSAILMSWYSGDEGGNAIADVLFGDEEPGGRLPCTWPRSAAQLPPYKRWTRKVTYGPLHGYRLFNATGQRPAYWFGQGQSYTTFELGDAVTDHAIVSVAVTNTGDRTGSEVVQAYVDVALGTHRTPLPTLAGFARIKLDPSVTSTVRLTLDERIVGLAASQEGAGTVRISRSSDPSGLTECRATPGATDGGQPGS